MQGVADSWGPPSMINSQVDITCFGLVGPSSVQRTHSLDMNTHKNVCMFANEQMNKTKF